MDFAASIAALEAAQNKPVHHAGSTALGPTNGQNFLSSRGLDVESVMFVEDGHGIVYIRGKNSWTACHLWQLKDCVLCVNVVDHFTMPEKFAGIFNHDTDLVVSIATGRDFSQIAARVFAQENNGDTYPAAARKLRQVMNAGLCERLRVVAIMRGKKRMVRFAHEQGPDRLKRLYTNLTFAPAKQIGNTTLWVKQVHDEPNQR